MMASALHSWRWRLKTTAKLRVIMDTDNAVTVAMKACCSCSASLLEYDRYCRQCGVRQPVTVDSIECSYSRPVQASEGQGPREGVDSDVCRPISGALLDAMVTRASRRKTAPLRGRLMKSTVLALISLPIWLLIVLLSPLDAYLAARSLSRGI